MKNWESRAKEIAYSLNPAFCARLLYGTINSYIVECNRPFPFPLIYLVLPLLLHHKTREAINSKTPFINWTHRNEPLLIDFAERAKSLVPISNEALEFLLQSKLILFSAEVEIEINYQIKSISQTKFAIDDVVECIRKCQHIGKWFARIGRVETIYITLGVRP
jgi:hypothetical protein